ncbi:hypothetical protein CVT24_003013 [Panaeolus cyanescens]|uniref:Uncharacterized protein n=1 Tax=Panaeolus cyanescens TaxID=181874 RepID=A0A409VFU3_9AGAR|nr:hypothetical protein CVT24_003013 [Panaeolus cyanescens]
MAYTTTAPIISSKMASIPKCEPVTYSPPARDGYFAFARVNGSFCLVEVSYATPASALTAVDVKIFRHEFISIFRYSESKSVHPADFSILEKLPDHLTRYEEESGTVFLARELMEHMRKLTTPRRMMIVRPSRPSSALFSMTTTTPLSHGEKEKGDSSSTTTIPTHPQQLEEVELGIFHKLTRQLLRWGIETHGTGSAGPAFFSLGIRDTLIILLVVDLFLYGAILPSALNVLSSQGFLILNCIIGGQALASASPGKIDDTLGIVIISVISLVITFCGYRFLHWFESFAWIAGVICLPVLLGVAGKHLNPSTFPPVPPATASQILSFACFVGSSLLSWCTLTPDYGVYHDKNASSLKLFTYTYLGFFVPSLIWHMVGAALAAAAPGIPTWQAGFQNGNNIGGLIVAALSPVNGFGKFLIVLLAISTSSACAPTMYTFGGIGYWSTIFAAIVLTEHFVFRRGDFARYKVIDWNNGRNLPLGIAAVLAFFAGIGAVVPCISQTWYKGPIARAGTGDIGIIMGGVVGGLSFLVLRWIEKKLTKSRQS